MSISFTAEDSPMGKPTVYECMCVDYDTKKPEPDCRHCYGTGEVRFNNWIYDMNMSNGNAWPITKLFTPDGEGADCGIIEAVDMPAAIEKLKAANIHQGYKERLMAIFMWAKDNNKSVTWG